MHTYEGQQAEHSSYEEATYWMELEQCNVSLFRRLVKRGYHYTDALRWYMFSSYAHYENEKRHFLYLQYSYCHANYFVYVCVTIERGVVRNLLLPCAVRFCASLLAWSCLWHSYLYFVMELTCWLSFVSVSPDFTQKKVVQYIPNSSQNSVTYKCFIVLYEYMLITTCQYAA
jgi:hypothetical protein